MSVEVVMDDAAQKVFASRAMAAGQALEAMAGVKDANITVRRDRAAGDVEFYTFNAACEATSVPIAGAAMEATLKTMSDGLMHTLLRAPVAEIEEEVMNPLPAVHYMGYVRALISNQPGVRAAAQRQATEFVPYGTIKAGGPDVV